MYGISYLQGQDKAHWKSQVTPGSGFQLWYHTHRNITKQIGTGSPFPTRPLGLAAHCSTVFCASDENSMVIWIIAPVCNVLLFPSLIFSSPFFLCSFSWIMTIILSPAHWFFPVSILLCSHFPNILLSSSKTSTWFCLLSFVLYFSFFLLPSPFFLSWGLSLGPWIHWVHTLQWSMSHPLLSFLF